MSVDKVLVQSTIKETIERASKSTAVTHKDILELLLVHQPDADPRALLTAIKAQVPNRLRSKDKINVQAAYYNEDAVESGDTAAATMSNLKSENSALKDAVVQANSANVSLAKDLKTAKEQLQLAEGKVTEIRITDSTGTQRVLKEAAHSQMQRVVGLAGARKNVMMYGPTGSGKTHLGEQAARALDLPFRSISFTSGVSEGKILGSMLPTGENGQFERQYTAFRDAFENGGVFLADELDAADANVLLVINSALSNESLQIPGKKDPIPKHPDFVMMATTNTIGTGADRQYSGRTKLDGATLDRFAIGKVFIDYDKSLESSLCPDTDLLSLLWSWRKQIQKNRLERAMSTRFILDAFDMKSNFGWKEEDITEAFFMGWPEDERNRVLGSGQPTSQKAKAKSSAKDWKHF